MKITLTTHLGIVCFMFIAAHSMRGEKVPSETRNISYTDLNSKVQIIGQLGLPLGDVIQITGEVYGSRMKIHSDDITLKVLSINGKRIEKDHPRIVLRPDYSSWTATGIAHEFLHFPKRNDPDDPFGQSAEFRPPSGTILECIGYESGGFVGRPRAIYGDGLPTTSTPDFHFLVNYYAAKVSVVGKPKAKLEPGREASE